MMRNFLVGLAMGIMVVCASCATSDTGVTTKVTTGGPSVEEIASYQGPKARIAVGSFEVKAAKAYGKIGDGLQEMLIDALFKTNRFIVLESASLKDIKGEYELGESGWASNAPEKGTFETADIILTGAITAFEPDYQGRSGGGVVVPLPWKVGGGVKIEKKEAYIAASLRLVDVRTRRVLQTGTVEGYSSKSSLGLLGGGLIGSVALGAGFESYKNTPMEQAVNIMLENAITEIVKSVPLDYYRYTAEGKTMAPQAAPQTAPPAETTPAKTGLGIIGGQDRFTPGGKVVFFEDFTGYSTGAVPEGWFLVNTSVEVAEYSGKKWLRFLLPGQVQRKVKTTGDYSVEMNLFMPDEKTTFSVKYGNAPDITLQNTSVNVGGNLAGEVRRGDGLHRLEFSKKGEQVVFFIDGKRIYTSAPDSSFSENLTVSVKGIDINKSMELLFTDLRISEYK